MKVSRWRYTSDSLDRASGPALTDALLAEEAKYGATEDVCWAYAEALPELLGDAVNAGVIPLGFWRGNLTAAKIDTPVRIAGLEYVQTSSPEVCRLYAGEVPRFKVQGRPAVEALVEAGGAVRLVEVAWSEPFEIDAPFELRFLQRRFDTHPRWFGSFPNSEFLIPVAPFDFDVWLCWDRDYRRPRVVRDGWDFHEGRHAPRDVVPEAELPPWAAPVTREHHGHGWSATSALIPGRTAACLETDTQRWLLLKSLEGDPTRLLRAWREQRPMAPELDPDRNEMASFASLSLDGSTATYEWIGLKRVLRVRDGQIEQLTTDHDLLWLADQPGSEHTPDQLAWMRENAPMYITTNALPAGVPSRGECEVQASDRFVLVDARTHDALRADSGDESLADRLSRGSAREVAEWVRGELLRGDEREVVVVIDADAEVAPSTVPRAAPESAGPVDPAMNDLVNYPERFHGQRIRCRGIFHSRFEGDRFADAWFDCHPRLPNGAWLVDVEGDWTHAPEGTGHMGQYGSRLAGSATLVDVSSPRVVPKKEMFGARKYVPLRSEVTLQRRLEGWTWNEDRWLYRLGADCRLPSPEYPLQSRATITWMMSASGALALFSWEIHDEKPLEPKDAMPTDRIPRGRLVRLAGLLRCPEPTEREWTTWPTLDGVLPIVPPERYRAGKQYEAPHVDVIERIRGIIGDGMIVKVVGEMAHDKLYALSIESPNGLLDI